MRNKRIKLLVLFLLFVFITVGYSSLQTNIGVEGYVRVPGKNFLKSTTQDDTTMFRSSTYKSKIETITFESDTSNVPESSIRKWDVSEAQDESIIAYLLDSATSGKYDLYIASDEQIYANPNMSYWFYDLRGVTTINNLDLVDTTYTTDMSYMFSGSYSMYLTTLELSGFDTIQVTDMSRMFEYCLNLTSLDVSGFNTSNVTDMSGVFTNCENLKRLNLSNFDMSHVTNIGGLLYNCKKLTTIGDISNWDLSNVTSYNKITGILDSNKYGMFEKCSKLSVTFIINNPTATNYDNMFYDAATETGALITVNYTSETSSLVDSMIATKSDSSNVVKGSLVT